MVAANHWTLNIEVWTEELKIELAVHLYENRRLSIGHAREMAGLSLWEFRQLLASRKISPHYSVSDLDRDVETWTELDRDFSARWDGVFEIRVSPHAIQIVGSNIGHR